MICKVKQVEFGDFQTPKELTDAVFAFLAAKKIRPNVIVEPTCGIGNFVTSAVEHYPSPLVYGFDINPEYIDQLGQKMRPYKRRVHLRKQDFFDNDWASLFNTLSGEILIVGNPPWVTNAVIGSIQGYNLPQKSNFQNHKGFAAKTGKANFDISEWMLIKLIEALGSHKACIAMLCKTATARKVLKYAWLHDRPIHDASLHIIDAKAAFNVAVDACLFIVRTGSSGIPSASVYSDLSYKERLNTFGLHGKELVADIDEHRRLNDLDGISYHTWRSGVKHDAAKIMEFARRGHQLINGANTPVEIEKTYLFPMLKSSDLANGKLCASRFVLLTQTHPSEDTSAIKNIAPATWHYLSSHASILDGRKSMIYNKRPRFSIFGVGPYTFAPWKVAVSGLYKTLHFRVVGSLGLKPIVVDDTCYFIPCQTKPEADFICDLLNSDLCQRFLKSLVFFDSKRPLTIDVLNRIDLKRLADKLGVSSTAKKYFACANRAEHEQQLLVFEKKTVYQAQRIRRKRIRTKKTSRFIVASPR